MLKSRLEIHPNLIECELEDRVLPAAPILMPIPFLPYSSSSNSFIVQGFSSGGSGSSGGSSLYPGEPSFYLRLGFNLGSAGNGSGNGSGSSGQSAGSTFSINGYANSFVVGGTAAQLVAAAAGGGGGGGGGGSGDSSNSGSGSSSGSSLSTNTGGAGDLGSFAGYGANISSGYSFALNSANNFGMAATTLGSVPVHTFAGGGDIADGPNQDNPAAPNGANPNAPMTNPETGVGPQGPNAKLYQNLLGKNPGQIGSKPAMPSPQPAP